MAPDVLPTCVAQRDLQARLLRTHTDELPQAVRPACAAGSGAQAQLQRQQHRALA